MKDFENNCFSYFYKETGLTDEEIIIPIVPMGLILHNFDVVDSAEEADGLAVMVPMMKSSVAIHMALINDDKQTVRHRRGDDEDPSTGAIDVEIAPYLKHKGAERIFLRLKPGTKLAEW